MRVAFRTVTWFGSAFRSGFRAVPEFVSRFTALWTCYFSSSDRTDQQYNDFRRGPFNLMAPYSRYLATFLKTFASLILLSRMTIKTAGDVLMTRRPTLLDFEITV